LVCTIPLLAESLIQLNKYDNERPDPENLLKPDAIVAEKEALTVEEIEQDPFIKEFMEKLSSDQQKSFSEEQLQAIKVAFGARTWGIHSVDIRGTFKLLRWRYYYVVLAGRNRRSLSRAEQKAYRAAEITFLALFVTISTLFGLLIIYLVKSAMGIDLIPGFSLGIWGWFKEAFLV